jgi:type II secretory pathway predicted ATPase ExeA
MSQSNNDQRRAFLSAPNPERYFAAGAIEDARQRIVRAIARSEGPAILVGGAGTGKSLLLAVLAEQFAQQSGRGQALVAPKTPQKEPVPLAVVTLAGAQLCTRRALLQMILFELGLEYRDMDEGELRLAIRAHLRGIGTMPANTVGNWERTSAKLPVSNVAKTQAAGARRLLLLVDEADTLPIRLLEELRVLTNVSADGLPLVSLVLAGGPILEERFAEPQLDVFAQRLAARCYLAPLGHEETHQYVRAQVAAVGIKPEKLFTADAYSAIHSATGGVPRLVNQLGDQLVWMAEETGVAPLDAALVQQAWSELQQLPAPWNSHGAAAVSDGSVDTHGVIEFGELDAPVGRSWESAKPQGIGREESSKWDVEAVDVVEDEMPASIPIASARGGRLLEATLDLEEFDASIEAAEELIESFDEFDHLELRADDAPDQVEAPGPGRPGSLGSPGLPGSHRAKDPFAEPFEEEEIVLDPYSAFESELLRTAPQVVNRLDRAFASELHRCVQRAVGKGTHGSASTQSAALAKTQVDGGRVAAAESPLAGVRVVSSPEIAAVTVGEVLLIEDDEESAAAAIIPGRQFRRLFSSLEASGRLG